MSAERCKNLYQFIRERLGEGISDREIARRWGMEWKSFSALKHGRRRVPRIEDLERLALVLSCDPVEVFQAARGMTPDAGGPRAPTVPAHATVTVDGLPDRVRRVVECVPVPCVVVSAEGIVEAANEGVADVCPGRARDLVGRRAIEVFGNVGSEGCPATRALLTGRQEKQVCESTDARGHRVYVHRIADPVVEDGDVKRVVELHIDVSEPIAQGDVRVLALFRKVEPPGPTERRRFPRADARFRAEFFLGDRKGQAEVENYSSRGLFLRMAEPAAVGAEMELAWTLPGDGLGVRARGIVVWRRQAADGALPGVGVQLLAVSPTHGFSSDPS